MNDQPHPGNEAVSSSLLQQIDHLCDRFEDAWKAGRQPHIEDYLEPAADPSRSLLLRELLAVELEYRCQRGETVVVEQYRQRFPQDVELVNAVFQEKVAWVGQESAAAASSEKSISTDPAGAAVRNPDAAENANRSTAAAPPVVCQPTEPLDDVRKLLHKRLLFILPMVAVIWSSLIIAGLTGLAHV